MFDVSLLGLCFRLVERGGALLTAAGVVALWSGCGLRERLRENI